MRLSRIYCDLDLVTDQNIFLSSETSHYLSRVLRLIKGYDFILFNGRQGEYHAKIGDIQKDTLRVFIGEQYLPQNKPALFIHLAQAISTGDKMDWTIQKAVELGVSAITPLLTEHGTVKLDAERKIKRQQHWKRIIISACEQCGRNDLPQLLPIEHYAPWITQPHEEVKFFCQPAAKDALSVYSHKPQRVLLLIGPEGGLSEAEVDLATLQQFTAIALGPRILRTETAALTAIVLVQRQWGDLR